jgi:AraC family transcriptional regulator, activator of mtrCDE
LILAVEWICDVCLDNNGLRHTRKSALGVRPSILFCAATVGYGYLKVASTFLCMQACLVIMPRGAAHELRSVGENQDGGSMRLRQGQLLDTKTNLTRSSLADVEILCGELEFGGRRRSALLEALPEQIVIQFDGRPEFDWLSSLVRLMAHEIEKKRPGAASIVAALSSTLFTLAVRAHLDTHKELGGLLGLMCSPRLGPVLKAMLEQPENGWTVESLAHFCNLSRASFAREFKHLTGGSPLQLLTNLRMELASRLLMQGKQDTATIGEMVGYRSEAAFSRAFTSYAGITPGRFRSSAAEDSG